MTQTLQNRASSNQEMHQDQRHRRPANPQAHEGNAAELIDAVHVMPDAVLNAVRALAWPVRTAWIDAGCRYRSPTWPAVQRDAPKPLGLEAQRHRYRSAQRCAGAGYAERRQA